MTYKLELTTTTGSPADGIAVNTATATLMSGNIYASGESILFSISGSARFDNGQQKTTAVTGATGVVSLSFNDLVAETVTIVAVLESDATVLQMATSTFSNATPGDNELFLDVMVNNAKANGVAKNQLQALVRSKTTMTPVSGVTCSFSAPGGSAKFDNGSKAYTAQTDVTGVCNAYLTDTTVESVAVSVTIPGNQTQTQAISFTGGDPLTITEVSTLNDKQFSLGNPTVAWIGAEFRIMFSGGSGEVDWAVDNSGIAVQSNLRGGVILRFADYADAGIKYTVTGTDKNTREMITYSFFLEDFYVSFGSVESLEVLYAAGGTHYLPSPEQLHNLYAQWGKMSNYEGWTDKKSVYWTNAFDLILKATVVNITNNEEGEVLVPGLQFLGYAKLNKKSN